MKTQLKLLCLIMTLVLLFSGCHNINSAVLSSDTAQSDTSTETSSLTVSSEAAVSLTASMAASSKESAVSKSTAASSVKPASKATTSVAASASVSVSSAASSKVAVSSALSALSPDSITTEQIVETLNGYFKMDPLYSKLKPPYTIVPSCAYNLKFTAYKNTGSFDAFDYRIDIANYASHFRFFGTALSESVLKRETMLKELLDYIERQGRFLCNIYPGIRFSCSFYEPKMTIPTTSMSNAEMNLFYLNVYRKGRYFTWQNYSSLTQITENNYKNSFIGEFHWNNSNDVPLEIRSTQSVIVINGDDVSYKN